MKEKNEDNPDERLRDDEVLAIMLASYLRDTDDKRFTSQDICDNLRDTYELTPDAVTRYMMSNGWTLVRIDDKLVWSIKGR